MNSIRYLMVGDKRFTKVNWDDYRIYKEEKSSGQDKIFSYFGGVVFVNTNADVSGTLTAYGKYMPADIADGDGNDTTDTVFSEGNDEGNQAIINEVISYIYRRENKPNDSVNHHNLAIEHLERLWTKIREERALDQTVEARGGQFKRLDVLSGGFKDTINNEDRFF